MALAGLWLSEVIALRVDQPDEACLALIAIEGKDGTRRNVEICSNAMLLLASWIEARRSLAAPDETALFVSRSGTRMSARSIQRLVVRWRAAIGKRQHLTPHGLRHTFCTISSSLGGDIRLLPA